eukprot:5455161-Pleurochrysis_carterae.AAC.1
MARALQAAALRVICRLACCLRYKYLNCGSPLRHAARPKLQPEPRHVDASLLVTRFDTNAQEIYALA